jgi:sugar phosphate isomerase/epimerase
LYLDPDSSNSRSMPAYTVGACSWSLAPRHPVELVARLRAALLDRVQLALDPLRLGPMPRDLGATLAGAGITIASGMMAMAAEDYSTLASIRRTGGLAPNATWTANRAAAGENAAIAHELGLDLVTFHAGFVPERRADPARAMLVGRLREVLDLFGASGVRVGLETGQEHAETLLDLLDELAHPAVGVNFDPANVVLYGSGDPIAALALLAPHVLQVHLKDALPPREAGGWGTEVPMGQGAVDWAAFFATLQSVPRPLGLMIEREAGPDRVADVAHAVRFLHHIGVLPP